MTTVPHRSPPFPGNGCVTRSPFPLYRGTGGTHLPGHPRNSQAFPDPRDSR